MNTAYKHTQLYNQIKRDIFEILCCNNDKHIVSYNIIKYIILYEEKVKNFLKEVNNGTDN